MVKEDPAAVPAGAGLEPLPRAIDLGPGGERDQEAERRFEPEGFTVNKLGSVGSETHFNVEPKRGIAHLGRELRVERPAVVGKGEGAQALAQCDRAGQVVVARRPSFVDELARCEPGDHGIGVGEGLAMVAGAEIEASVHEGLNQGQTPRRRPASAGLGIERAGYRLTGQID